MEIGPLQLLAIGLEEPALDGTILNELALLSESGLVRLVDLLGVYKDDDGNVIAVETSDMDLDEAVTYGAWVGALVGLGAGDVDGMEAGAFAGGLVAENEYEYGLDEEAVASVADDIPPGGAAVLAVIEHVWPIPLRNAIRAQGGIVIAQDFLNPETLVALGAVADAELVD